MKTIWGAVLLAMMMLATAALAADLDTPRIGAAVCAPARSCCMKRRTGGAKR